MPRLTSWEHYDSKTGDISWDQKAFKKKKKEDDDAFRNQALVEKYSPNGSSTSYDQYQMVHDSKSRITQTDLNRYELDRTGVKWRDALGDEYTQLDKGKGKYAKAPQAWRDAAKKLIEEGTIDAIHNELSAGFKQDTGKTIAEYIAEKQYREGLGQQDQDTPWFSKPFEWEASIASSVSDFAFGKDSFWDKYVTGPNKGIQHWARAALVQTDAGIGQLFDRDEWSKNWEDTYGLDTGTVWAWISAKEKDTNYVDPKTGYSPKFNNPESNDDKGVFIQRDGKKIYLKDLDIHSSDDRKIMQSYAEKEGKFDALAGGLVSDTLLDWTNLLGPITKGTKLIAGGAKLSDAVASGRFVTAVDNKIARAATIDGDKLPRLNRFDRSVGKTIDWLVTQKDPSIIEKHKWIPEGSGKFFASAKTPEDVGTVFKALAGDSKTMDNLEATDPHKWTAFNNYKLSQIHVMDAAKAGIPMNVAKMQWASQFKGMTEEAKAAFTKSYAERALSEMTQNDLAKSVADAGLEGTMRGGDSIMSTPRMGAWNGNRATKRAESYYSRKLDTRVFVPSDPFSTPVRIVRRLAGQNPSGVNQVGGYNSVEAHAEALAQVNDVPMYRGRGKGSQASDWVERKQQIVKEFDNDVSQGVPLPKAWSNLTVKIGQDHADQFANGDPVAAAHWMSVVMKHMSKRNDLIKEIKTNGNAFLDDDGLLTYLPDFDDMGIADEMPQMDWGLFHREATQAYRRSANRGIHNGAYRTVDSIRAANRVAQRLMRTSVLLRLGYPMRSVPEALGRGYAVAGSAMLQAQGGGRVASRSSERKIEAALRDNPYQADGQYLGLAIEGLQNDIKHMNSLGVEFTSAELVKLQESMQTLGDMQAAHNLHVAKAAADSKNTNRAGFRLNALKAGDGTEIVYRPLNINPEVEAAISADVGYSTLLDMRHTIHNATYQRSMHVLNSDVPAPVGAVRGSTVFKNYMEHSASHYNMISGSELTKMRLGGVTGEEFFEKLHSSSAVSNKLRKDIRRTQAVLGDTVNINDKESVVNWYNEGTKNINRMFPVGELTEGLSLGRRVDAKTLSKIFTDDDIRGLPSLKGAQIVSESAAPIKELAIAERLNRGVSKAFHYGAAVPENRLARTPFAEAIYNKEMEALTQGRSSMHINANLQRYEDIARKRAILETKRVMYTPERLSNIAAAFEPFSMFFQAKLNSTRVWATILAQHPMVATVAAQLWDRLDGTNDKDFSVNIGKPLNALGFNISDAERMNFDPSSLLSAYSSLFYGDYGFTDPEDPNGTNSANVIKSAWKAFGPELSGPVSATAASAFLRATETDEIDDSTALGYAKKKAQELAYTVLPFGPSDNIFEDLAPTQIDDLIAIGRGENSSKFARLRAAVDQEMHTTYLRGGAKGDPPSREDINNRTRTLLGIDFLGRVISPFTQKREAPYSFMLDERRALLAGGMTYGKMMKTLNDKYGDDYMPMIGARNTMPVKFDLSMHAVHYLASDEAAPLFKDGKSFSMDAAKMLVGVDPNLQSDAKYDAKAASILGRLRIPGDDSGKTFRQSMTYEEMRQQDQIDQGYREWNNYSATIKDYRDKLAKQWGGYAKIPWATKERIGKAAKLTVQRIVQENPVWANSEGYGQADSPKPEFALKFTHDLMQNKKVYAKAYESNPLFWNTVEKYVDFRNTMQWELSKYDVSSDIYDPKGRKIYNSLKYKYSEGVDELRSKNTDFDNWYKTWLQSEDYEPTNDWRLRAVWPGQSNPISKNRKERGK